MTSPRTIAIIQGRMSSSRLPGKIMLDIAGQPMLVWVVRRTRQARQVHEAVVATTTAPTDKVVAEFCETNGIPCYRGSSHDVLDRYYQAALQFQAEVIVRITADCPLIDPGLIDDTLQAFYSLPLSPDQWVAISECLASQDRDDRFPFDFAANRLPLPWGRSFPIGLDVEVCTFRALEHAWLEADQPHQREHVMPYFYEKPGQFRFVQLHHTPDYGKLRWTVDTPEDLDLVRQIVELIKNPDQCTWLDIIDLFQRHPELAQVNAKIVHKNYLEIDHRQSTNLQERK